MFLAATLVGCIGRDLTVYRKMASKSYCYGDRVLVWLSIWSEVQIVCMWSS